jgi:demethylmenaquinone methyltransferase/2-methoxy-6-polyprenyl-1,4-benzoquinol methylase
MAHLTGTDRARYVQGMFSRIARRYDLMNRLMTAGQDVRWRREVVRRAGIPESGRLLDLGAGTGDLAWETRRQHPGSQPVAADFTLEMMRVGKSRPNFPSLDWSAADALRLPFLTESFDAVVSGFLLRNVVDVPQALSEQYRVLKPGGRVVVLDTTQPTRNLLSPLINFHLHVIIPFLGRIIAGASDAYTYLPESTEAFLQAEQLAAFFSQAGFKEVGFRRLMFGTVAIHWGRK